MFLFIILFIVLCILLVYRENTSLIEHQLVKKVKSSPVNSPIWNCFYQKVDIKSSADDSYQKAYFYKSTSAKSSPLVVSLHTWSGDYTQADPLAELCRLRNLNYIHPDFRGRNNSVNACCSDLALSDVEDAITYVIKNANVDTARIYLIGKSGGGYATLCMYMKSAFPIKKYSAWASVTDLIVWYEECLNNHNYNYTRDILKCTGSKNGHLNSNLARGKSPVYWRTPVHKFSTSVIALYAGIYDSIVPVTHSINFYNKLLTDLGVKDSLNFVTQHETSELTSSLKSSGEYGKIANRRVYLRKEFQNIKLVIFDGSHEMISEFALNELLEK